MHIVEKSEGSTPLVEFRRNREGNIELYLIGSVMVWAALI